MCIVDSADEFTPFGEDNPFGPNVFNISEFFRIKTRQFRGVSLEEMREYYGRLFEGPPHKAIWDSRVIAKIFLSQIGD